VHVQFLQQRTPVTPACQVSKLQYMPGVDKYLTCGNDGTFRLWNSADLRHFKTVHNSGSWVTDALFLPAARRLVLSTMDRAISYYDIHRGSYDLVGRVYASGNMGVPLCLASLQVCPLSPSTCCQGLRTACTCAPLVQ
jgi:WD40 repeat protein